MKDHFCFNCEYSWTGPHSEECPSCGSDELNIEDAWVDDIEGHFEGDFTNTNYGDDT